MALFASVIASGQGDAAKPGVDTERQLTANAQGHLLTNINVWSPDGQWIVYDLRNSDGFDGTRIEQVNVRTGEVQRLYESKHGANCGVVTYSPTEPRVVFIHGPEDPDAGWSYSFTHRRGSIVEVAQPGLAQPLDALNFAPPFVDGALRGGSHVHVFSPDGQCVSFTYEDEVLAKLDATAGAAPHEPNQRNIGVSIPRPAVRVGREHSRNHDSEWFSVLVTRTEAQPRPGSDEISKAYEEGWIGRTGYVRADGQRQKRALAFQGLVTAINGKQHSEVFVVDLPKDMTATGEAPLGGTATTRPAPPRGTQQRRLTFTSDRKFPGVAAGPRHWIRASPDGEHIAFLMQDDQAVVQLWTISPNGGQPRQVTHNPTSIASTFTWSPEGRHLAHVMDGSVCLTDIVTGETVRLTMPRADSAPPSIQACVFSPDGRALAYMREVTTLAGTFKQIFTVDVPATRRP